MLFNSYAFIFLFLPICVAGFFLLGRSGHKLAIAWLAIMSLAFYSVAGPKLLSLLLGSIVFNYLAGQKIIGLREAGRDKASRLATAAAIAVDLGTLAIFKYANFATENVAYLFRFDAPLWHIVLPIGISFYTFTQIAYLSDAYKGRAHNSGFREYVLFVSYFPHLIAGPIMHHAEMIPQFLRKETSIFSAANVSKGLAVFIVGLGKKVLIADTLAIYANEVFGATSHLAFLEAWIGAIAYTLQLYFDFSGYCDMAIGISLIFNIELPLNFYSPYKASSIIEFWRRWHMTLSRFLRDYLYIPLGGNRHGSLRRYLNLMITMVLGGLWHGAAWTFVAWGTLHGFYLLVNHAFRSSAPRRLTENLVFKVAATGLTFACVVVAWVFFRSETFTQAWNMLQSMAGFGRGWTISIYELRINAGWALLWIAVGLLIAGFGPNTQQLFNLPFHPGSQKVPVDEGDGLTLLGTRLHWRPSPTTAIAYASVFVASVLLFVRTTQFLYFRF